METLTYVVKGIDIAARHDSTPSSASEALVEELLGELIGLPAVERAAGLRAICAQFPEHAEVLSRRLALLESQLPMAMATEQVIPLGRFELVRRLGSGMTEVYQARDPRSGGHVVVKVLRRPELLDAVTQQSFAREVMAASRLNHPCIGTVLEVGAIEDALYLVQPYQAGITLADWIRQMKARGRGLRPVDVDLVLRWLEDILRALHAAHKAGLVHRDVKPSNILLPFQGRPQLLDFGLCKQIAAGTTPGTPTPIAGTLAYMAPELLVLPARPRGPAADIYALGATMHECLALRPPFEGDNEQALCRAILLQDPPDPRRLVRGLSRGIRRVLACSLAKSPDERYRDAAAFADDLARLLRGDRVAPPRARFVVRLGRWCSRHRWTVLPAMLAAVLSCAALFAEWALARAVDPDAALLAIAERVRVSEAHADALVPGWPEQVPALREWLRSEGEPLQALLPRLRERTAALDLDPGSGPALAATLRSALALLEPFAAGEHGTLAAVRERLDWAQQVEAVTIEAPAAAWRDTIAAIAADPRYGGLRLQPQLDLVPLGRDPRSGLFEFYHPRSSLAGSPAVQREAEHLTLHEFSGLVFVLIPAGKCEIGEQRLDPLGPRYDPDAAYYAKPHEVELSAFFISKYEMTQGQWWRITGERPSCYRIGQRYGEDPPISWQHPVESINALVCDAVLRRIGLALPTEAQWEYACGTGVRSWWFFGDDPLLLVKYANIDDRRYLATHPGAKGTLDVDDGFGFMAPVGRFAPNPFGLHDVMGNVSEWCRDECADYLLSVPAPGDGMRTPHRADPARSFRGSHHTQSILKTSSRPGALPDLRNYTLGLRPVRPVSERPR